MTTTDNISNNTEDSSKDNSWSSGLTTPTRHLKPYQSLLRRRIGYSNGGSQHYMNPLISKNLSMYKVTKKITRNHQNTLNQTSIERIVNQPISDTVSSDWIKDMIERGKDILNKSRLKEQKIIHDRFKRYAEQQKTNNYILNGNSFEPLGNSDKISVAGSANNIHKNKIDSIETNERQEYEEQATECHLEEENAADVCEDEQDVEEDEEDMDVDNDEEDENSEPSVIVLTSEDEKEEEEEQKISHYSNNEDNAYNGSISYSSQSSSIEEEEQEEEEEELSSSDINEEYSNDLFGEQDSVNDNPYDQNEESLEEESYEEEEEEEEKDENSNEYNQYENITVDFQKYMIPRNHVKKDNNISSQNIFKSSEHIDLSHPNTENQQNTNIQVEPSSNDVVSDEYNESYSDQVITDHSQEESEVSSEEDSCSSSTQDVEKQEIIDNYEEEVSDHYDKYSQTDQESVDQESNAEVENNSDDLHNDIIYDVSSNDEHENNFAESNSSEDLNSIQEVLSVSEDQVEKEDLETYSLKSNQSLENIAKNAISQMYAHLENQQFNENLNSEQGLPIHVQSDSDTNEEDGQQFLNFVDQNIEKTEHKSDSDMLEQSQDTRSHESEHEEMKEDSFDHQKVVERENGRPEKGVKNNESGSFNDTSVYYSISDESDKDILQRIEVSRTNADTKNTDQYEVIVSNSVYSNTSADNDNGELFPLNNTYVSPFVNDPFTTTEVDETSKLKLRETLALLDKTGGHDDKLESDSKNMVDNNTSIKSDEAKDEIINKVDEEVLTENNIQKSEQLISNSSQYDAINHEYKVVAEDKSLRHDTLSDGRVNSVNIEEENKNSDNKNNNFQVLGAKTQEAVSDRKQLEVSTVDESNPHKFMSEDIVLKFDHNPVGILEIIGNTEASSKDVDDKILIDINKPSDNTGNKLEFNSRDEKLEILGEKLDSCESLEHFEALHKVKDNSATSNKYSDSFLKTQGTENITENTTLIAVPKTENISSLVEGDSEVIDMNHEVEEKSNVNSVTSLDTHEIKEYISLENNEYIPNALDDVPNLNHPSVVKKIIFSPIKAVNAISVGVQKISSIANRFMEVLDSGDSADENENGSIIEINSSSSVEENRESEFDQEKQDINGQSDVNDSYSMLDIEQKSIKSDEIRNLNETENDLTNKNPAESDMEEMSLHNYDLSTLNVVSVANNIESSLDITAKQNESNDSPKGFTTGEDNLDKEKPDAINNLRGFSNNSSTEALQENFVDERIPQVNEVGNDNEARHEITSYDTVAPSIQSSLYAANKLFELAKEIDENTTVFIKNQITKSGDGLEDSSMEVDCNHQIQVIKTDGKSELEDYPANVTLEEITGKGASLSSSIIASTTITTIPKESSQLINKDTEISYDNEKAEYKIINEASPQLETSKELPSDPPSDEDKNEHKVGVKDVEAELNNEERNNMGINLSETEGLETENIPVQNQQQKGTSDNPSKMEENNTSLDVSNFNHSENVDVIHEDIDSSVYEDDSRELTRNDIDTSFEKPLSSAAAVEVATKQEDINKNKRKHKQKSSRHQKKRKLPITGSHITSPGRFHTNKDNKNNSNGNYRNKPNNNNKNKKFKKNNFNHGKKKI